MWRLVLGGPGKVELSAGSNFLHCKRRDAARALWTADVGRVGAWRCQLNFSGDGPLCLSPVPDLRGAESTADSATLASATTVLRRVDGTGTMGTCQAAIHHCSAKASPQLARGQPSNEILCRHPFLFCCLVSCTTFTYWCDRLHLLFTLPSDCGTCSDPLL